MKVIHTTLDESRQRSDLGDRRALKIVIRRFVVDVVEMENVHFHHNSAVVLQWRYGENSVAQGRLWHRNGAPQ